MGRGPLRALSSTWGAECLHSGEKASPTHGWASHHFLCRGTHPGCASGASGEQGEWSWGGRFPIWARRGHRQRGGSEPAGWPCSSPGLLPASGLQQVPWGADRDWGWALRWPSSRAAPMPPLEHSRGVHGPTPTQKVDMLFTNSFQQTLKGSQP